MTTDNEKNTGLHVAILGGAALLLWLLWRGRRTGGGRTGSRGHAPAALGIWLRSGDRIELDGIASDLPTVVERARAAGMARVHVTGDTRHGWAETVDSTLREAGIDVDLLSAYRTSP